MESGGFIRSRPGVAHPDIQFHFLPSQVIDHGRVASKIEAFQVYEVCVQQKEAFCAGAAGQCVFVCVQPIKHELMLYCITTLLCTCHY